MSEAQLEQIAPYCYLHMHPEHPTEVCGPPLTEGDKLAGWTDLALYTAEALASAKEEGAREPSDYFGILVDRARVSAEKASIKFPQPNYVTLKIAEEAGEVVRGAVHYAEGRMPWSEVEGEIVQLLAMLIRFVTEGDRVNGVIPPEVP